MKYDSIYYSRTLGHVPSYRREVTPCTYTLKFEVKDEVESTPAEAGREKERVKNRATRCREREGNKG